MPESNSEENFVQVPHRVMEYLMTAKLNMTQFRIMNAVIRNTYGYHVTWNWFSLNYLSQLTGCSNPQVTRELGKLIENGILLECYEDGKRMLRVNPSLEVSNPTPHQSTNSLVSKGTNSSDSHIKKKINKKDKEKYYINFDEIDDPFLNFYLTYYKKVTGRKHVRISEQSYVFIQNQIEHLIEYGTTQEEWKEKVRQFFKDPVKKGNNRSIAYFLRLSHPYFEVYLYNQFDK